MSSKIVNTINKIKADNRTLEEIKDRFNYMLSDLPPTKKIGKDYKTFIFWYQGINDKTPKTVKLCFKSIYKYCKNIILISKDNFQKYVDIPQHILKKFYLGKISITHFSDILRVWILEKYGGLWIDASIFIYKPLPDISNYYFYSIKNKNHKWVVGFMATGKNNPLFKNLKNIFSKYWEMYDEVTDYFLFDYFIEWHYEKKGYIYRMINSYPYNNENVFKIFKLLYKPRSQKKYLELIKDGYLYNVTYKHQVLLNLVPFTPYKRLIKENNIK